MTQDHDLELPLTAPARDHAHEAAQEPIQQTRQHDAQSEPITSTAALAESNFFTPHGYGLVLFLHLCALFGAVGTAALLHFAEARLWAADTVAAVRLWAGLIEQGAKVFPLALLVLLASGAYLVDQRWTWSSGWVDASLVGVGVLFIVGAAVIGGRSRALRRELADATDGAVPARLAQIAREHVGGIASWTNTGLALGIVFVMTTKPALAGSLAALVVSAGLGTVVALRLRRIGRDRVA